MFIEALFIIPKKVKQSKHLATDGYRNVLHHTIKKLFNHKKKWSTDPYYNLGKPQKYCSE